MHKKLVYLLGDEFEAVLLAHNEHFDAVDLTKLRALRDPLVLFTLGSYSERELQPVIDSIVAEVYPAIQNLACHNKFIRGRTNDVIDSDKLASIDELLDDTDTYEYRDDLSPDLTRLYFEIERFLASVLALVTPGQEELYVY